MNVQAEQTTNPQSLNPNAHVFHSKSNESPCGSTRDSDTNDTEDSMEQVDISSTHVEGFKHMNGHMNNMPQPEDFKVNGTSPMTSPDSSKYTYDLLFIFADL